jgi:chaperone BCS1
LDIYVISLLEPTLSEEDLNLLFTSLPRRCVVLLEDIDTAGLLRSDADDDKETKETKTKSGKKSRGKKPKPKKSNSGSDSGSGLDSDESDSNESTTEETKKDDRPVKVSDIAKYFKKANRMSEEDERKRISLSGLLNAIDGVASHEGRVLVMTTNKPEKLDDALIRPGRVDLQVAFGNASTKQIEELFVRMYSSDQKGATKKLASKDTKKEPHGAALSPAKAKAAINAAASTILSANPFRAFVLTPPRTPPETPVEHDTSITATATTMQSDTTTANTVLPPDATAVGNPTTPEEDLPLPEIAHRFAGLIPDGQFSPAEIQGFLLKRKKDPVKALREVEKCVASMVEAKKGGGKVLDVQ